MSSKYSECLDKIHVPDALAKKTLEQMTLYAGDSALSLKRKARGRFAVSLLTSAAALCLFCTGIYACTSGWLWEILGDSASVYETGEFSPVIENIRISCSDTSISAELDSAYIVDKLLLYRLHITSADSPFFLPEDEFKGGFLTENIGEHSTIPDISPWSAISMTDSEGGIYMNCTLMSPRGFSEGDTVHITAERIGFWYSGENADFRSFNVLTSSGFDIEFKISGIPESQPVIIDVGQRAEFNTGKSMYIEKITVTPLFAAVAADTSDEIPDDTKDISLILESGEALDMTGIAGYVPDSGEIILIWGTDETLNPIDPNSVSQIRIGSLTVSCKG